MSLSLSYAGPLPAPLLHPQHGPRAWGQLTPKQTRKRSCIFKYCFSWGGGVLPLVQFAICCALNVKRKDLRVTHSLIFCHSTSLPPNIYLWPSRGKMPVADKAQGSHS